MAKSFRLLFRWSPPRHWLTVYWKDVWHHTALKNNGVDQSAFLDEKWLRAKIPGWAIYLAGLKESFEEHHLITECLLLGLISHPRWSDPKHFSYTDIFSLLSSSVLFFIITQLCWIHDSDWSEGHHFSASAIIRVSGLYRCFVIRFCSKNQSMAACTVDSAHNRILILASFKKMWCYLTAKNMSICVVNMSVRRRLLTVHGRSLQFQCFRTVGKFSNMGNLVLFFASWSWTSEKAKRELLFIAAITKDNTC